MDLNATLLSEIVVFGVFLVIVQKRIWPLFLEILEKRQEEITSGLAAAQKSKEALAEAKISATGLIDEAKQKSADLIDAANARASLIEREAKELAEKTLAQAKSQAEEESLKAQKKFLEEAKQHYASLVTKALGKIHQRPEKESIASDLVNSLVGESTK